MGITAETILAVLEKYPPVLVLMIRDSVSDEQAKHAQEILNQRHPEYKSTIVDGAGENAVFVHSVFGDMKADIDIKELIEALKK